MENKIVVDVAIIGSGPAGLTCAIYASRANLNVAFIEKAAPGGKMTSTYKIENWSGDQEVKGYELAQRMLDHAKKTGAQYIYGNVINIESINEFEHVVYLNNEKIVIAKAVVIATGMKNREPQWIENYQNFENKGLSYCVICDASFYKGKPGAIIGGGDSAFEEAIYLSSIASEVHVFVRKDKSTAEASIISKIENIPNIKIHYNANVTKLIGNDALEEIEYIQKDKNLKVKINHIYPYIGFDPINDFVKHLDIFDEKGFIITNDEMETKVKGVFAIGDIRKKHIRQIVTAASDGAIVGKILANKLTK